MHKYAFQIVRLSGGDNLGISMALCELDSDESLCKQAKMKVLRVHLDSVEGLEDYAEYDLVVPVEEARKLFGDQWESFQKRNRLAEDQSLIYLEKIKKDSDRKMLESAARKIYTGWFRLEELPEEIASMVLERGKEDVLTAWDMLSFDEMGETCGRCKLAWDKGRGCIGTFGPDNTVLPEIARKYGCEIIAAVPEYVKSGEKLPPQRAEQLLEEVRRLREKLPLEGKMMVRRYGGVLDRLENLAKTCIEYGTRFYFI